MSSVDMLGLFLIGCLVAWSLYWVFVKCELAFIIIPILCLPLIDMTLHPHPVALSHPSAYGTRTGVLYAEYKDDSGQVVLVREPGGSPSNETEIKTAGSVGVRDNSDAPRK